MTNYTPAKGGCWRVDETTGDLVADVQPPPADSAPIEIAPPPIEAPPPPSQTGLMDEEETY